MQIEWPDPLSIAADLITVLGIPVLAVTLWKLWHGFQKLRRRRSVSQDCVEFCLEKKTLALASLEGTHVPHLGEVILLPPSEMQPRLSESCCYEVEKVIYLYGRPDRLESAETNQPISATLHKAIVHLRAIP